MKKRNKKGYIYAVIMLFVAFLSFNNANAWGVITYTGSMTRGGNTYTDYFITNGYNIMLYNSAEYGGNVTNEGSQMKPKGASVFYAINCDSNFLNCGYENTFAYPDAYLSAVFTDTGGGNYDFANTYTDYGSSINIYSSGGSQSVIFTVAPTCIDGILNQDETAIDYGGICGDYLTNESNLNILTPLPNTTVFSPVTISGRFAQQSLEYDNVLVYIVNSITSEGQTVLIPIPTEYNLLGEYTTSLTLADGSYYIIARLYNSVNYTFGAWYPNENSIAVAFQVGATPPVICEPLDIFCYMTNALQWAFIPDDVALSQFEEFKTLLESKAPFGYVKQIYDTITGISYDSNSEVIILEEVTPITDNIFTPIKTALTWLLYFAFIFMLFKRFKDIQI